jgi:hypothetical protein
MADDYPAKLSRMRPGAGGVELARAMLAAMGVTEEQLRRNVELN